jgi:hypothetical protein
MLKDSVHDKLTHRHTMEGVFIECEQDALGVMFPNRGCNAIIDA